MRTRLVLTVLPLALVGVVAATPGTAAPKETTGKFTAAGSPDPSATAGEVCQGLNPASRFEVPLKITSPSKFTVEISGYAGDWDLTVESKTGAILGSSAGFVEATKETITLKIKKATEIVVVACNFSGGPTANGTYKITPNK